MVDDADGVGGTWHWNTYPGIAVDIPSYSYQFSYEMRPDWSRTYAHGNELKGYAEQCVEKYKLGDHIRFNTTITAACFDENATFWRLTTAKVRRSPHASWSIAPAFSVGRNGLKSRGARFRRRYSAYG